MTKFLFQNKTTLASHATVSVLRKANDLQDRNLHLNVLFFFSVINIIRV